MTHKVTVIHDRQKYVWDGQRWYNAVTYTVPHTGLIQKLERLVSPDVRRAVLGVSASPNGPSSSSEQTRPKLGLGIPVSTYQEVLSQCGAKEPTYEQLLLTAEWQQRREQVLARDHHRCRDCGTERGNCALQVHHGYYILDRLPWEYPDDALITLCEMCHEKLHVERRVLVYESVGGQLIRRYWRPCIRCHGVGVLPQYYHVEAGICFRCHGKRFDFEVIDESDAQSAMPE